MKKSTLDKKLPNGDLNGKPKKSKKGHKLKRLTKSDKTSKAAKVEATPYREIEFSDGHGFYIRTACNLMSDDRIQVMQYREHIDPDGTKFVCTEPTYFENKNEFLEWLFETLRKNFDDIPYITIKPVESSKIKKHERETTDAMYL